MEKKSVGIHQGAIHQGGAISAVPKRIFVPLKRYGHPKIEPKVFRTRFVNRS